MKNKKVYGSLLFIFLFLIIFPGIGQEVEDTGAGSAEVEQKESLDARKELNRAFRRRDWVQIEKLTGERIAEGDRERRIWYMMAVALKRQKKQDALEEFLKKWRVLEQEEGESGYYLSFSGQMWNDSGDQKQAEELWLKALPLLRQEPFYHYQVIGYLQELYVAQKRWDDILALADSVEQMEGPTRNMKFTAMAYLHKQQWVKATDAMRQVREMHDGYLNSSEDLIGFEILEMRLTQVQRLEKQAELEPKNPEPLMELGLLMADCGFSEIALSLAQEATERAPTSRRAQLQVGTGLIETGHEEAAKKMNVPRPLEKRQWDRIRILGTIDAEVVLSSRDPKILTQRAYVLNSMGFAELAILDAEEAISKDPELAAARIQAGISCRQMEDIESARNYFKQAMELAPDSAQVLFHLAESEGESQQYDMAITLLQAALQMEPSEKIQRLLEEYQSQKESSVIRIHED